MGGVCVPCAGRKMAVGLCNEVWDLESSWHSPHINIDKVYIVTAGKGKWHSIACLHGTWNGLRSELLTFVL
jgi:hypothetical protein